MCNHHRQDIGEKKSFDNNKNMLLESSRLILIFFIVIFQIIAMFPLSTYKKKALVYYRDNNILIYYSPVTNRSVHHITSPIGVIQTPPRSPEILDKNIEYCRYHSIQYLSESVSPKRLLDLFDASDKLKYLLVIDSDNAVFVSIKHSIERLIEQAGNSSIILTYDKTGSIRSDVFILKRDDIVFYKLNKFIHNKNSTLIDIFTDPVYINKKLRPRSSFKELPVFHYDVCIYHEDAVISSKSPFLRLFDDLEDSSIYVYPWKHHVDKYFLTIQKEVFPRQTPTVNHHKIPKNIFQTMETTLITKTMNQKSRSRLLQLNPNYHYMYFTSIDCEQFIAKYFPKYVLSAYKRLLPSAFQADLFRYCVLYHYGGIYCDSQVLPYVAFDDFIDKDVEFISAIDPHEGLWQGFLGCTKNHPFLFELIRSISMSVMDGEWFFHHLLKFTGPECIGHHLHEYLGHSNNSPTFVEGKHVHSKITYQLLSFSSTRPFLILNKVKIMLNKYSDFNDLEKAHEDLLRRQDNYHTLYTNKAVYREILLPGFSFYDKMPIGTCKDLTHRKIISVCMIYDELNILEFRLRELWDVVDEFVVVELDKTHSGEYKPFYVSEALKTSQQLKSFQSKMNVYRIYCSSLSLKNGYDIENYHRMKSLEYVVGKCNDNDMIVLSDLDEIVDPEFIQKLQKCMSVEHLVKIYPHWFNYGWNHYLGKWDHPIDIMTVGFCKRLILKSSWKGQKQLEAPCINVPYDAKGPMGWHTSYFIPFEKILRKIEIQSTMEGDHLLEYVQNPKILLNEIQKGIAVNTNGSIHTIPFQGNYPRYKYLLQDTVKNP